MTGDITHKSLFNSKNQTMKLLRNILTLLLLVMSIASCTPEDTADEELGIDLNANTYATGDDNDNSADNDKDGK